MASPAVRPSVDEDETFGNGVDALYDELRAEILDGRLAPGASLSQVQLGRDHGVSRTKLREAMRMLVHEGLIELRGRTARVADVSAQDLDELYAQRLLLETSALRHSVPSLTPDEVGELEGFLAQMAHFERVGDYERWDRPHRRFHELLIAHSGPRMRESSSRLADHATRYRKLFHASHAARAAADVEHRAILDAVIDGDADRAATELARHLARTPLAILHSLDAGYDPVTMREALRQLIGDVDLPERVP